MKPLMIIVITVAAAVVVLGVWSWVKSKRRARHNMDNVIDLKTRLKAKDRTKDTQICSKCHRKRPIIFYADDTGAVQGLCNECKRELGQHRELYPV